MVANTNQRNYQMETNTNISNNNNNNNNNNGNVNMDEMSQRKEKIIIQNQMFINVQQQQQQQSQQQHVVKRAPKKLTQPPAIFSTTTTTAAATATNDNNDGNNHTNNSNNQDIANFIANSPTAASYVQAQLNNINGLNITTTATADQQHHQQQQQQQQHHHQLTANVVAASAAPTATATVSGLPIVTYNGNQYCVITHTGDITSSATGEKPDLLQVTTDKEGKTNFILMQSSSSIQPNAGDIVNN
ncbi:hypothetical protein CVS40_9020 [Lucilia cuprina]|nr:hypothetical protein CVS40_9020 [Lucilia cuprina]